MPRPQPSTLPKTDYYVVIEPKNGLRIAGRRRALGDKISLSEPEARFLLLEGVISATPPAPATPAAKPSKSDTPAS